MRKTAKKKPRLTLKDIIKAADKGYGCDGVVMQHHDGEEPGDTLAKFVSIELRETFDKKASRDSQIDAAEWAIESAITELQGALDGISKLR